MIDVARLLALLAPHGFQLAWEHWLGRQFHFDFVRPSVVDGVFEHIAIDSMGKRGEAVYCSVWVSPLRGHRIHFKPSPEVDEVLVELGDSAGQASTSIESRSDAIAWELRVAEVAPERVRDLAQRHAQQVALQTASARQAALEYVRRVREMSDERVMEYLAYQLRSRATPAQQQLANRFRPWGAPWDDVQEASEAAGVAIALFGADVDPEQGGFAEEPARKSPELKLRLNIVADLLRRGALMIFDDQFRQSDL
jgi:hypothetical protein